MKKVKKTTSKKSKTAATATGDENMDGSKNEVTATDANSNENDGVTTTIIGHPHSDISKARISAANKGKVPWNVGKKHSDETKARIAAKTKEAMLRRRVNLALEAGFSSLEEFEEKKKQDKIALKVEKDKTKVKGLTAEGRKRISDR